MRSYVIATGVIFGLLTVVHLWRMIEEPHLATIRGSCSSRWSMGDGPGAMVDGLSWSILNGHASAVAQGFNPAVRRSAVSRTVTLLIGGA